MGIMKQREEHVANEIDAAEKSHAEAKKLVEEQREILKEARVEAQELIENAKKQGEDQKDVIVAAREEAERLKNLLCKKLNGKRTSCCCFSRTSCITYLYIASKVIEKELMKKIKRS